MRRLDRLFSRTPDSRPAAEAWTAPQELALEPTRPARAALPAATQGRAVFLVAGLFGLAALALRGPDLAGPMARLGEPTPGDAAVASGAAAEAGLTEGAMESAGPTVSPIAATLAKGGLVLGQISVAGRRLTDRRDLLEAVGVPQGGPILAVDPERVRESLEALPWVARARVERHLPDHLLIVLTERRPLALWQHDGSFSVIADDGTSVAVDPAGWGSLPLVVGDDAPRHAAAFLDLLARHPALKERVVAATLVGGRRWTLHIDDLAEGPRVLLPETGVDRAMAQLVRLDTAATLLSKDLARIDMRLDNRIVVRPRDRSEETQAADDAEGMDSTAPGRGAGGRLPRAPTQGAEADHAAPGIARREGRDV